MKGYSKFLAEETFQEEKVSCGENMHEMPTEDYSNIKTCNTRLGPKHIYKEGNKQRAKGKYSNTSSFK